MIFRKPGSSKSGPQNKKDMKAPAYVVEFFKRNKEAKAVHCVLDRLFEDLGVAERHRKSIYALKVNTWLRHECAAELGETNKTENED